MVGGAGGSTSSPKIQNVDAPETLVSGGGGDSNLHNAHAEDPLFRDELHATRRHTPTQREKEPARLSGSVSFVNCRTSNGCQSGNFRWNTFHLPTLCYANPTKRCRKTKKFLPRGKPEKDTRVAQLTVFSFETKLYIKKKLKKSNDKPTCEFSTN